MTLPLARDLAKLGIRWVVFVCCDSQLWVARDRADTVSLARHAESTPLRRARSRRQWSGRYRCRSRCHYTRSACDIIVRLLTHVLSGPVLQLAKLPQKAKDSLAEQVRAPCAACRGMS